MPQPKPKNTSVLAEFFKSPYLHLHLRPPFPRHYVNMCRSHIVNKRNYNIFDCVVIGESDFLLCAFRFLVAVIVAAPNGGGVEVVESVANQSERGFGRIAVAPVRNANPKAQFNFGFANRGNAVAVEQQAYAANRAVIRF